MSNDVAANPLIIDTAAATVLITSFLKVTKFRWIPSAASQAVVVKDKGGIVRWAGNTIAAATEVGEYPDSDFHPPLKMDGLIVSTLTSGGFLYIYLDDIPIPVKTT